MLSALLPLGTRASKELVLKVHGHHSTPEPQHFAVSFNYTSARCSHAGGYENPKNLQAALVAKRQIGSSRSLNTSAPPNTPTENNSDVFSRTLSTNLTVMVQPSLRIHTLEVLPLNGRATGGGAAHAEDDCEDSMGKDPSKFCLLGFQVENRAQEALNISICADSFRRHRLLQTRCCERFHIPVQRLSQAATAEINALPEADMLEVIQKRLQDACTIEWVSSRQRSGTVKLPAHTLLADVGWHFLSQSLRIDFVTQDKPPNRTCEIQSSEYSLMEVAVRVTNTSPRERGAIVLSILPFQDLEQGSRVFDLEDRLEWVGSLECMVPAQGPGESFTHTIGLVSFSPGVYKVSALCRDRASLAWNFGDDPSLLRPSMGTGGASELDSMATILGYSERPLVVTTV